MIASWPSTGPAGKVCEDLVDFSDVLPTLADLAGAKLPSDISFDGRSFAPQLRGEKGQPREWNYCWYSRNGARNKASQHVRDQTYKLYADGRMYNVVDDFYEKQPLDINSLDAAARGRHTLLSKVLGEKVEEAKRSK